jgi:hypothetical protein
MTRDLDSELDHETGEWPAAWKPKPGDKLVGIIRRYSVGTGMYGPVRTCILELMNGSRVSVWLSSAVLLSLFERERPKIGERIGIKFLGKHQTKAYKLFALVVDRDQAEPDFSPLGGEQDAEADAGPFDFGVMQGKGD